MSIFHGIAKVLLREQGTKAKALMIESISFLEEVNDFSSLGLLWEDVEYVQGDSRNLHASSNF